MLIFTKHISSCFNPRPRREGDGVCRNVFSHDIVSIHALAGRATRTGHTKPQAPVVSIHALAGRATAFCPVSMAGKGVSIHALAGRATEAVDDAFCTELVSIHALAGRATTASPPVLQPLPLFQSTPSQGGRPARNASQPLMMTFQSTPSQGGRPCVFMT